MIDVFFRFSICQLPGPTAKLLSDNASRLRLTRFVVADNWCWCFNFESLNVVRKQIALKRLSTYKSSQASHFEASHLLFHWFDEKVYHKPIRFFLAIIGLVSRLLLSMDTSTNIPNLLREEHYHRRWADDEDSNATRTSQAHVGARCTSKCPRAPKSEVLKFIR